MLEQGICVYSATVVLWQTHSQAGALRARKGVTCPPNLSPLTQNHTTKAPLPLTAPIPIHPSCHKQIPSTTLCPVCLCVQGNSYVPYSVHIHLSAQSLHISCVCMQG